MQPSDKDTIVAIATPPGEGGIGIVRLSGKDAIALTEKLFTSSHDQLLSKTSQRVFHGYLHDTEGHALDEALVHIMRAPHSYTREDVVEINCHGGAGPLNAALEEALEQGARLAKPGEFTQRAFLNGRIDLVQAEAVIDQIRARTKAGLRAATAAARGKLSTALHDFSDTLVEVLAYIEAAVDFPEEDLPELVDEALIKRVKTLHGEMTALLETAEAGRLYREGTAVAIAGRPNVGKSSLFNALLRDARAIVTAQAGTTRDRLEEYITLAGVPVKLIDTAGLRHTEDEVEAIGVAMTRETLQSAHLALLVMDVSQAPTEEDHALLDELRNLDIPVVLVQNKTDLVAAPDSTPWEEDFEAVCPMSALTGEGLKALEDTVSGLLLGGLNVDADQAMLNRTHQRDSLRRAEECVAQFLDSLAMSPEFLALELREALQALGEITGETTPEDILDRIFSSFCLGK